MKQMFTTLAFALAATSTTAFAAPISLGAALASPTSTIKFSEIILADNTVMAKQYASLGLASVSGMYFNGCGTACVTTPGGAKPELSNFAGANFAAFNTVAEFNFTAIQNAALFQFASNGGQFTLTSLLGGKRVESFDFNGGQWGNYGFANSAFDSIRINAASAFLFDNLQLVKAAEVPEPGSLSLLAIALAGLGFSSRRRKAG